MKNRVASVQDRLKKIARTDQKSFQLLLIRYFQERILYRLSCSSYREHFCLKGGALMYALEMEKSRPTMDLDLLGMGLSRREADFHSIFRSILKLMYEADGVTFDLGTIASEEIAKEGHYSGIRIKVIAQLGNIRQNMQVDIGFGDFVTPAPVQMKFPTLLEMDAPELLAYSPETVIAEKFEAMIDLAETNSRMKDFYDLFRLLQPGQHDPEILRQAISNTFRTRETAFASNHSLFTDEFALDEKRILQWQSFLAKSNLEALSFSDVHLQIVKTLKPLYDELSKESHQTDLKR
jgi:predicted nucleotidyltransferase component of viral defense system